MPWPGAAQDLANAFGFILFNGFVVDTTATTPTHFSLKENYRRKEKF